MAIYFELFESIMTFINYSYIYFPQLKIFRYFLRSCVNVQTDYYFLVTYDRVCVDSLFLRNFKSILSFMINSVCKLFLDVIKDNADLLVYIPYMILAFAFFSYLQMTIKVIYDVRYVYQKLIYGKKMADKLNA